MRLRIFGGEGRNEVLGHTGHRVENGFEVLRQPSLQPCPELQLPSTVIKQMSLQECLVNRSLMTSAQRLALKGSKLHFQIRRGQISWFTCRSWEAPIE